MLQILRLRLPVVSASDPKASISTILAVQAPSVANGKKKAPPEGINCASA